MYIKKLLAAVAILGVIGFSIFTYHIYQVVFSPNTAFSEEKVNIYVPSDATYADVRQQLIPYVEDINAFDVIAGKKGYTGNVKPGRFILKKGMNNNEMVNVLRSKNIPVSVIFNNQNRLPELAGRISDQIEADSLSLLKTMKDTAFLKENGFNFQTALSMYIPNKYEFYWNTSAEEFRERMLEEYKRFWTEERLAKAEALGLDPLEVMALASIVQEETVKVEERPKVAGVYVNRLEQNWKLEADPTVIYALKDKLQDFDTIIRRVLYKDLEIDSPYNTYMYPGLPPGPIAMPDISSIDAVLNPENHDYMFFVASVDDFGYHKFAETLREHNRNKQEYIEWINNQDISR